MTPPRSSPQPHRSLGLRYLGVAGFLVLLGLAGLLLSVPAAIALASSGFLFGALGVYLVRVGPAVQLANGALDAMGRGKLAEAEALLDAIPKRSRTGTIGSVLHLRRATLAFRRGQLADTVSHATKAIETRGNLVTSYYLRQYAAHARGLRALALASLGEDEPARVDLDALRAFDLAPPQALASASLADAVVLARHDDRGALASLFARDRRLLLEYTTARERAVVRALQRMMKARATSVYREPGKREEEPGGEPPLASWIATIAPGAAAYAPSAGPSRATMERIGVDGAPAPESIARVNRDQAKAARAGLRVRARRALLLWIVLVVFFLLIWQLSSPGVPSPAPPVGGLLGSWLLLLLPVILVLSMARATYAERQRNARLIRAARALALGNKERARDDYTAIAKLPGLAGASAELRLADLAERERRWDLALAHCDAGLEKAAHLKASASDLQLPELLERRAFALAALGQERDASTQLAALTEGYPSYWRMSQGQLRIRLMQAVRAGDIAKARALARERTPDLPLDVRDETLADLLVAAEDRVPGEIARLNDELGEDAELREWLEGVAPGVVSQLRELAARTA